MAKKSYVCRRPFFATSNRCVHPGETFPEGHEYVTKDRVAAGYFADAEQAAAANDPTVEQATAAPGEKRNVKRTTQKDSG